MFCKHEVYIADVFLACMINPQYGERDDTMTENLASLQFTLPDTPFGQLEQVLESESLLQNRAGFGRQYSEVFYASLDDESVTCTDGDAIVVWLDSALQGRDNLIGFDPQSDTLALDLAFAPSLSLSQRLLRLDLSQQGEDGALRIKGASGECVQTIILQQTNLLENDSLSSQAALQRLIENGALLI